MTHRSSAPRAVVVVGARFIYEPVTRTLEAGLGGQGYTVRTQFAHLDTLNSLDRNKRYSVYNNIVQDLRAGDALFWVGIHPDAKPPPGQRELPRITAITPSPFGLFLSSLTALGVFTVHYETEAVEGNPRYLCYQVSNVTESWHYAPSNVARCVEHQRRTRRAQQQEHVTRFRYLPPGFLSSPLTDISNSARHLLFVGRVIRFDPLRQFCVHAVRESIIDALEIPRKNIPRWCMDHICYTNVAECNASPCPLKVAHRVKNDSQWREHIAETAFYLNVHKSCEVASLNNTKAAMGRSLFKRKDLVAIRVARAIEAFRLAPLLSAGAVILSERSDVLDEQAYAGLVHFLSAVEIGSTFAQMWLKRNSLASASHRAAAFERRFAPSRLFEDSGANEALASHRAALGGRVGRAATPDGWCKKRTFYKHKKGGARDHVVASGEAECLN